MRRLLEVLVRGSEGKSRGKARIVVAVVSGVAALGLSAPSVAADPAMIKVAPRSIDFGTKVVGTDYFDSVKITNTSGTPLRFLVEGGLPDDFGFGLYPGSTCPALTPGAILAPRESCRAVVRFTPSEFFVGWDQTGSLTVTATDPATDAVTSVQIPVSGSGRLRLGHASGSPQSSRTRRVVTVPS